MREARLIEIERRIASATADTVVGILMDDVPELLAELRVYMGIFGEDTQAFLLGGNRGAAYAQEVKRGDAGRGAAESDRGSVPAGDSHLQAEAEVPLRRQPDQASTRRTRRRGAKAGAADSGADLGHGGSTPLPIEPRGFGTT